VALLYSGATGWHDTSDAIGGFTRFSNAGGLGINIGIFITHPEYRQPIYLQY
jgi:hypothetical protein